MGLLDFIQTADPRKVQAVEVQKGADQVTLLESTKDCFMSLVIPADRGSSSAAAAEVPVLTEERQEDVAPEDAYLNLADPDEDALAVRQGEEMVVSEQPKKVKRRRLMKQSDALPAKKLRTDHPSLASGTGGKTLANLEQIMPKGEGFVDLSAQGSFQILATAESSGTLSAPVDTAAATTTSTRPATAFKAATDVDPSHPKELESPDDSFYEIPNVDPAMAKRWYVPKWNITNDSLLDDAFSCRTLVDRVALPAFLSDLRTMGYDQLFTEFNVGAAWQICLGSEVRSRTEHELELKEKLRAKYAARGKLLEERDLEILELKSKLAEKETEAAEAIRLRDQVSSLSEEKSALITEVSALKVTIAQKDHDISLLDSHATSLASGLKDAKVACTEAGDKIISLTSERDRLISEVSSLHAGFQDFKKKMEVQQEEQAQELYNRVAELEAHLALLKYLKSSEYQGILGHALGQAVDFGMQAGLEAGHEHGYAGRSLSVVDAYNPEAAKANYIDAVKALWNDAILHFAVVMSFTIYAVTYTSVYTDSEPDRAFWGADDEEVSEGVILRVIILGYDGLPMQPTAPPLPDYIPGPKDPQTPPVPQDEDEREPMFVQAHDLDYVPEPIYPEYIPLEDEHEFLVEEQPLPPVDSPTAKSPGYVTKSDPGEDPEEYEDDETGDGPVDYPMDGGDDGDNDDGDSSGDDADGEDEDDEDEEEKEEEHLAPANSAIVVLVDEPVFPPEGTKPVISPPSTDITIGARITVRPQTSISLPPEVEVERLLAMTTPSPSPPISLSPPSIRERLVRSMAPPVHSSPPPAHSSPLLPSFGCPTQIQTLRISSTQALINAVTAALPSLPLPPLPPSLYIPPHVDRRDKIPESEQPPHKRLCLSTLGSKYEFGESSTAKATRGQGIDYRFVSTVDAEERRQRIRDIGYDIRDIWVDPAEAVLEIAPMTVGEVNTRATELAELHEHDTQDLYALLEDTQDIWMVEEEVYASREAWAHSIGLSQMQQAELAALRETGRRRQAQMVETLRVIRDMTRVMNDM
ncbi:hypothetical protein Tco_1020239 [Tanacetum coccineum]|uniref:Uncharacterized protein n=1 Tax=Tanacetum coccineum TaxID=301880 RepID=A0ABQ5FZW2_9ASTR